MKWMSSPTFLWGCMSALSRAELIQLAPSYDEGKLAVVADTRRAGWRLQRKILKALVVNRLNISDLRIDVSGAAIELEGSVANLSEIQRALTVVREVKGINVIKVALTIR
ncbi:BON domain-containing protein [Paraburkholderia caribensis]|uniref:BON domain-containing protein n=1 Tax=Paraburkholderia caribensis TaxID=75105 RepID=UPI00078B8B98|nr:BON domain-containing protein [Paraburkholderia caribensis]AMV44294.1 hypothetical protein ATN79_20340 [Paraburkholderia caribensis]